jgi:hypothetical protein
MIASGIKNTIGFTRGSSRTWTGRVVGDTSARGCCGVAADCVTHRLCTPCVPAHSQALSGVLATPSPTPHSYCSRFCAGGATPATSASDYVSCMWRYLTSRPHSPSPDSTYHFRAVAPRYPSSVGRAGHRVPHPRPPMTWPAPRTALCRTTSAATAPFQGSGGLRRILGWRRAPIAGDGLSREPSWAARTHQQTRCCPGWAESTRRSGHLAANPRTPTRATTKITVTLRSSVSISR